jgi:hypothetical protein
VVIEVEAEFGELPNKLFLAVVEIGIDAAGELVEQAGHGVMGIDGWLVMKLFHKSVPFR